GVVAGAGLARAKYQSRFIADHRLGAGLAAVYSQEQFHRSSYSSTNAIVAHGRNRPAVGWKDPLALPGRLVDREIVDDGAEPEACPRRANTGDLLIGLRADRAGQSHATVIDDDVDRRHCAHPVAREHRIAIDRARYLETQPVVEGRKRQHLQLVGDARNTGNALYEASDVLLLVGLAHRAQQLHIASIDTEVNVIPK